MNILYFGKYSNSIAGEKQRICYLRVCLEGHREDGATKLHMLYFALVQVTTCRRHNFKLKTPGFEWPWLETEESTYSISDFLPTPLRH